MENSLCRYQYFVVEGGTALKGRLAYPYPDIGYAVKIPKTATEARVLLASMKAPNKAIIAFCCALR